MSEQVWFADDVFIEFTKDDPVAKNVWLLGQMKNPIYSYSDKEELNNFFVHRMNFAWFMHMLFLNCDNPEFNVIRADFHYAIPFETVEGKYNTQQVLLRQVAR